MRTLLATLLLILFTAGLGYAEEPLAVSFQSERARMTAPSRAALDALAASLRADRSLHVHLTVFGEGGGDPLVLATRRADALYASLRRRGVPARQIHAFAVRTEGEAAVAVRWSRERTTPPRALPITASR